MTEMVFRHKHCSDTIRVYLEDGYFTVRWGKFPAYKKYITVQRYLEKNGFNINPENVVIHLD